MRRISWGTNVSLTEQNTHEDVRHLSWKLRAEKRSCFAGMTQRGEHCMRIDIV